MEMEVKNTKVMIISRQLPLAQNIIDQKQPEKVEYKEHFGNMTSENSRYT
jgi:hypothetical protein